MSIEKPREFVTATVSLDSKWAQIKCGLTMVHWIENGTLSNAQVWAANVNAAIEQRLVEMANGPLSTDTPTQLPQEPGLTMDEIMAIVTQTATTITNKAERAEIYLRLLGVMSLSADIITAMLDKGKVKT